MTDQTHTTSTHLSNMKTDPDPDTDTESNILRVNLIVLNLLAVIQIIILIIRIHEQ
jgi:hypothetical protein